MHLIVRQLLVRICWSSKIENVGCEIEEVVEKYSRNQRALRYPVYCKWLGDQWTVCPPRWLTHSRETANREAECRESKFHNHLDILSHPITGTLKWVVFYPLPADLNVLVVTIAGDEKDSPPWMHTWHLYRSVLYLTWDHGVSGFFQVIQMTHIHEGGKYVGPEHHQKHLCQQGAEVLLIKMFWEGTGCTPDESSHYFHPN